MKSKHFLQIQRLVKCYLSDEEDITTLADELHYLSCRRMKQAVAVGIVVGWITFGMMLSWAS